MLLKILRGGNIKPLLHHKRLVNTLIKRNILTIDKQISDKMGLIIRDSDIYYTDMSQVLRNWIITQK
jgi:hypothetical protein